jgi:hypothetical protein
MISRRHVFVIGAIATTVTLPSLSMALPRDSDDAHAVFVMTNDADSNEVIAYERTTYGMLFGGVKERGSKSMSSFGLVDPEVGDIAAASPCVAADSGSDDTRFVPLCARERLPVEVPRRLRVELVDALCKESLNLRGFANAEDDGIGRHGA